MTSRQTPDSKLAASGTVKGKKSLSEKVKSSRNNFNLVEFGNCYKSAFNEFVFTQMNLSMHNESVDFSEKIPQEHIKTMCKHLERNKVALTQVVEHHLVRKGFMQSDARKIIGGWIKEVAAGANARHVTDSGYNYSGVLSKNAFEENVSKERYIEMHDKLNQMYPMGKLKIT